MEMLPPLPAVAAPVESDKDPLEAVFDEPVARDTVPLAPSLSEDTMFRSPDD
jgi:hypothetical protein